MADGSPDPFNFIKCVAYHLERLLVVAIIEGPRLARHLKVAAEVGCSHIL